MNVPEANPAPIVAWEAGLEELVEAVVPQVARARAMIDSNPLSATHGCADRAYWHYRTLTNFPGASWQQLMLGFAALYRTPHHANPHYEDPELLSLITAMLRFWANECQHRDGAFDEWYLNEHSYCVTAITSAGAGLTLHILGDDLSAEDRKLAIAALERAGDWLSKRYNPVVMNQNLAAATALQSLAVLTGHSHWEKVARSMLERVKADQTTEGWLPEYSGADLGYSTLSLDQLAAFCSLAGDYVSDGMARGMADRLIGFLTRVQGAGNAMPGALGSRGTTHHFPYGVLAFAEKNADAAALAARWLTALSQGDAPAPSQTDDRYFAYFYFPQFALALMQTARSGPGSVIANTAPCQVSDLPESGLLVCNKQDWSVTVSRRLGGAVAVQSSELSCRYHLGYEVCTEDGQRYSSATWEDGAISSFGDSAAKGELVIESPLRAVKSGIPLRRMLIPFQITIHLLFNTRLAELFQGFIKERMITSQRTLPLRLRRRIAVSGDQVRITDELIPGAPLSQLREIVVAREISMHSPSAKTKPLSCMGGLEDDLPEALSQLRNGRPAILESRIEPLVVKEAGSLNRRAREN